MEADPLTAASLLATLDDRAFWARTEQVPPPGEDWRVWLMLAGRGFGKTRAGAEWVRGIAEIDGAARIALVGATMAEARAVMVEGKNGPLVITPVTRGRCGSPRSARRAGTLDIAAAVDASSAKAVANARLARECAERT